MVNFVRDWGREHPRSASRRLGFIIDTNWGPVSGLLTGPTCGPCRFQDPVHARPPLDPPGRLASVSVISCLGEAIAIFFCTARTLSENGPRQFGHVRAKHHVLAGTGICHPECNRGGFGRPAVTIV